VITRMVSNQSPPSLLFAVVPPSKSLAFLLLKPATRQARQWKKERVSDGRSLEA
jgi:hypothetical protein